MQQTALKGFLTGSTLAGLALFLLPSPSVAVVAAPAPVQPPTPTVGATGHLTVRTALDRSALSSVGPQVRYAVVELTADEDGVGEVPVHLSLVVDTSGSMSGQKLADAREAAEALVGQLDAGDSVSLVGFSTVAKVLHGRTTISGRGTVLSGMDRLVAGGDTNMSSGLHTALTQLGGVPGVRRMVLLGDGHATAGATATDVLAGIAGGAQSAGVTVSALGLGLDFDLDTMAAIADAGGGRYHYVESPSALAGMLADELRAADTLAAQGVTVEVRPGAGVTVLDVFGYETWDGRATATGWEALVGDMSSGTTRKVVAKLQIDPEVAGDLLGSVAVSTQDPVTGAVTSLTQELWSVTSDDPTVLDGSQDALAVAYVGKVHEGRAREQAAALRRGGRADDADAVLDSFARQLSALSSTYSAPELAQAGDKLQSTRRVWRGVEEGSRAEVSLAAEEQLRALGYIE